jgi:parallel beta-helix repeat protein
MGRLLLLLLLLLPGPLAAEVLTGEVHWSGQRQISEKVLVEKGARLTIAPGSRLEFIGGSLEVSGTLVAEQVEFYGGDWPGIILSRTDASTRLKDCRISGAKTGIFVAGGNPQLEKLQLINNQVGIELKQQSRALIRDSLFQGNTKVGLFIKEGSAPVVTGNQFVDNGRYGAYIFRSLPQAFSRNRFERNDTGLMIAYFGSDPLINDNQFVGNQLGIHADRSAKPQLQGNRLQENQIGIKLQRRADARVEGNLLQGNQQGIAVLYSSYPQIVGNDFLDNKLAVYLEHQSSTWEQANGAERRQQEEASRGAFGSKPRQAVTEEQRRPAALDGSVDARSNWWGAQAGAEINRLGADANLSFIHDSHDQPTFSEAGRDYPLDRVRFFPAAEQSQFAESVQ